MTIYNQTDWGAFTLLDFMFFRFFIYIFYYLSKGTHIHFLNKNQVTTFNRCLIK